MPVYELQMRHPFHIHPLDIKSARRADRLDKALQSIHNLSIVVQCRLLPHRHLKNHILCAQNIFFCFLLVDIILFLYFCTVIRICTLCADEETTRHIKK